jgi:tetratricopeptide (TPR) repeat protein
MVSAEKLKAVELFSEGRKYYKLMQFEEAKNLFRKALDLCADDGPSQVYLDRCINYIENPPSEDWDGVYVMTTK